VTPSTAENVVSSVRKHLHAYFKLPTSHTHRLIKFVGQLIPLGLEIHSVAMKFLE
jgi:hypothetical protein